ncbi:MAG: hypothetical protein JEZ07_10615 [Phycisphaerae bacterium]|nr:hypothetical protein [Phycisphaerae bacterium]
MLHHSDRQDRIHIMTLDHELADDIYERIHHYRGMDNIEIIQPVKGNMETTAANILKSARDTMNSRMIIFDVRNQTLPMLQRAYNEIVRFNRPDFNHYCYSILIGDGPVKLHQPNKKIDVFNSYLADLRLDYSPAVFFGNPFLHYSYDEITNLALYNQNKLPEMIPERISRYFKDEHLTVRKMFRYFRAADIEVNMRLEKSGQRLEKLKSLYGRILAEEFSGDKDRIIKSLTLGGCELPGEPLKLNLYPFFFEEWILELVQKAKLAA